MQRQMEQPEKILDNLFTTGFQERKTGKQVTFPKAKEKYAEYLLQKNWQEICGEHLAKYCCVQKIEEATFVRCSPRKQSNTMLSASKSR